MEQKYAMRKTKRKRREKERKKIARYGQWEGKRRERREGTGERYTMRKTKRKGRREKGRVGKERKEENSEIREV